MSSPQDAPTLTGIAPRGINLLETAVNRDYQYVDRESLYTAAVREFGPALDRLASGYESDLDKRRDLGQEIHLQLWRSLRAFDHRCSLKTWAFRVAHNVAASYVCREQRTNSPLVALEELEQIASPRDPDHERSLAQLRELILGLKPVDRQIMISYLEEIDAATIGEITGLSAANVAMKIHRIKNVLARRFRKEPHHA